MALICSCSLCAQQPLSIGDPVPDVQLDKLVNHSPSMATLSDFKGKLVIIDFWATWCTACLHAFDKLDSLQTLFPDQLKIILVNTKSTGDDISKVQAFFTRWQSKKGKFSLPSVVNDTILDKLFPHTLIPHYVWINKEGKLIAISSSEAVTAANIQSAWKGEKLSFTMKKDQDAARPVFSTADLPGENVLNYCVFLKEWFDGLPSGSRVRQRQDVICGRAMTNTSLLDMYKAVAARIDPAITEKRLIVSTTDSSELFPPVAIEERETWYRQHAYTIDLIVPVEEATHLYRRMLEVLNTYSGYTGKFEKRKMNCWVLVRSGAANLPESKGEKTLNNLWSKDQPFLQSGTMELLVKRFNTLPAIEEPVLDETGYCQKFDMHFPGGLDDLKTIQKQLWKYGLSLQRQQRTITVFLVQKKKIYE